VIDMMGRTGFVLCGLALIVVVAGPAHAESPWIDETAAAPTPSPSTASPPTAVAPTEVAKPNQRWPIMFAAMLGMRGDQGGLIDSGYRFQALVGVMTGPIDVFLAIDRQLGDDNRIPNTADDPARFSEWVGSARLGRAS